MKTIESYSQKTIMLYEEITIHLKDIADQPDCPVCVEWWSQFLSDPDHQIMNALRQIHQDLLRGHVMFPSPPESKPLTI